jgi:uncharacterized protein YbcC (UPF0753/DUF2309 family)
MASGFYGRRLSRVEMPNKEDGFMKIWRKLAIMIQIYQKQPLVKSQKTSNEALNAIMDGYAIADIIPKYLRVT